jgi:hypothetical protein
MVSFILLFTRLPCGSVCADIFFYSFLCLSFRVGERGSEGRKEGREGRLDWTGLDWTGLAWTIPPVRGRGRESMCAKHSLITLISSFPPSPSFIEIIQLAQDKPNFKRFPSSTSPITYLRRRIGARGSYCNSCSKTRQTLQ